MRLACGVEYDGEPYLGFQTQKQGPTIQSCLEQAIARVADHPIKVTCSGRTDTGVSAQHQVIHFDSDADRTERQWSLGINTELDKAISVLWVKQVSGDFHARFSALCRSYEYSILNRAVRPAIARHQLTWELTPLNHELMHEAVQYLIGTHDFSAFRSSKCQSHEPIKTIMTASVKREGQLIKLDVTANGFLHHMIRNIVGCLLPIGKREKPVNWMLEILVGKDRKLAGITAPANGLIFKNVRYPEQFFIPPYE